MAQLNPLPWMSIDLRIFCNSNKCIEESSMALQFIPQSDAIFLPQYQQDDKISLLQNDFANQNLSPLAFAMASEEYGSVISSVKTAEDYRC